MLSSDGGNMILPVILFSQKRRMFRFKHLMNRMPQQCGYQVITIN